MTLELQKKFRVTLENYDGRCKRVTVLAFSPYEAMSMTQKNGWHPVDVKSL